LNNNVNINNFGFNNNNNNVYDNNYSNNYGNNNYTGERRGFNVPRGNRLINVVVEVFCLFYLLFLAFYFLIIFDVYL
jgi:hypothetical protein